MYLFYYYYYFVFKWLKNKYLSKVAQTNSYSRKLIFYRVLGVVEGAGNIFKCFLPLLGLQTKGSTMCPNELDLNHKHTQNKWVESGILDGHSF